MISRLPALAAAFLLAGAVSAQQSGDAIIVSPLEELEELADDGFGGELRLRDEEFQTFEQELRVAQGVAGRIRVLDRTTGRVETFDVPAGSSAQSGRLTIGLAECRYPEENPASDGFAKLRIQETGRSDALFEGWMIASSPALAALDHHRYDVWVIRCTTGEAEPTPEITAGVQSPRPPARP